MAREDAKSEVSDWSEQACTGCGLLYPQRSSYERKCPVCFKLDRGYNLLWGDLSLLWAQEKILALQEQVSAKEKELLDTARKLKKAEDAARKQEVLAPDSIPILTLLKLCHPDKHSGSEDATEVTKKLLTLRRKPK